MIKGSVVRATLDKSAEKKYYQLGEQYVAVNNQDEFLSSVEVNRQLKEILQMHLTPILYINEGAHKMLPLPFAEKISNLLSNMLAGIVSADRSEIVFAYSPQWLTSQISHEDVWALHLNHRELREIIAELIDPPLKKDVQLAYAGPMIGLLPETLAGDININGFVSPQEKGVYTLWLTVYEFPK